MTNREIARGVVIALRAEEVGQITETRHVAELLDEAEVRGAEKALRAAAQFIEGHPAGRVEITGDGTTRERTWRISADAEALAGGIRALSPAEIVKEAQ